MALVVPCQSGYRLETLTGVVFVADDLAAWLIGALADAGRKKLTAWSSA